MNIQTKFLGEVAIDEMKIINFPEGIPAFEEEKEFVLLPIAENSSFLTLQSIKNQAVGFIVAFPFDFKKDYSFDLAKDDKEKLMIESDEDVVVYSILSLKDSLETSTMNLLAPVILNIKKMVAKQIVLTENDKHPIHYPLKNKEGSVR